MTTMLERAARASAVEWYCETSHDDAVAVAAAETQWTAFESLVRAALQAIRDDLPESIIRAGERAAWDDNNAMPAIRAMPKGFAAIITAILEEKPE